MRIQRLLCVLAVIACACVAPATQMGSISREDLATEQLRQQQLVVRSGLSEQQRVEDIGYPLLKAAVGICRAGAIDTRAGVRFANIYSFSKEYQPAARAMGFTDTLTIVGVTRGSPAERAGISVGDKVVGIGGEDAPTGRDAIKAAGVRLERMRNAETGFGFNVRRGVNPLTNSRGEPQNSALLQASSGTPMASDTASVGITVAPDTVCNYGITATKDDALNAFADGKNIYITSSMLRFANDDELAVVIAHEISHNAMGHIDAKKKNATVGAIFGAILDVAAASQGVNTGGEFTSDLANAASMAFSQAFESEADYVGLYILARAGKSISNAPDFWRRMAQENPGSIKFASSHPTTAERFLRLENTVKEIGEKRATGAPLLPEMKKK